MLKVRKKPSFKKAQRHYTRQSKKNFKQELVSIGQSGVTALSNNTPRDTGNTANSWDYVVELADNGARITWTNSVMAGNVPLVILIRYGHGTGTGGYVSGINFLTPALEEVYNRLRQKIRNEVLR